MQLTHLMHGGLRHGCPVEHAVRKSLAGPLRGAAAVYLLFLHCVDLMMNLHDPLL